MDTMTTNSMATRMVTKMVTRTTAMATTIEGTWLCLHVLLRDELTG